MPAASATFFQIARCRDIYFGRNARGMGSNFHRQHDTPRAATVRDWMADYEQF